MNNSQLDDTLQKKYTVCFHVCSPWTTKKILEDFEDMGISQLRTLFLYRLTFAVNTKQFPFEFYLHEMIYVLRCLYFASHTTGCKSAWHEEMTKCDSGCFKRWLYGTQIHVRAGAPQRESVSALTPPQF